ncbi:MAG: sugar transferase [Bacteroidales bacterium]|nr:sugar transferase [Bacteroidales bacterium]
MIRFFDIFFSLIGIILFMPFAFIVSLFILIESGFPIIFKQVRVGKEGKNFELYKFRSMYRDSEKKGLITVGGRDPRITKVGYFLRKFKIDELPQLLNVLLGHMSLVGPRPEVRRYVELYTPEQNFVLSVRPGITDFASIFFRNENKLLEKSDDPHSYYLQEIIPQKIALNMVYINNRSLKLYFKILFTTLFRILWF